MQRLLEGARRGGGGEAAAVCPAAPLSPRKRVTRHRHDMTLLCVFSAAAQACPAAVRGLRPQATVLRARGRSEEEALVQRLLEGARRGGEAVSLDKKRKHVAAGPDRRTKLHRSKLYIGGF